ncbi:MAG: sodium-dependent transporter [Alistipes sp.]
MLFLLLLGMALNALTLDGARQDRLLLKPDFSKITGATVLEALGQSFFSMSLGMGCMITYGSYLRKNENMFRIGAMVSLSDITVAVLSGLAIFPAVFSFGISPTSGPELVFLTLPNVFARMSGGYVISVVFFVLLFLAAITSSVSLLEVIIAYLSEEMRITRSKAIVCTACTVAVTGSLNAVDDARFGPDYRRKKSVRSVRQPVVEPDDAAGRSVHRAVRRLGAIARKLRDEMTSGLKYGTRVFPVVRFLIRFVIPVVIGILFASRIGLLF